MHALVIQLSLPLCHHDGGDPVSDHVHQCTGLAHEPVDAKDQRHSGNRDRRDDRERSDQRDKGSAGDA